MLYQTHVRINLANIRRNLESLRDYLGGTRLLFAVKANAYGHGAVAIASMAERAGLADWLGVATVPEGIELREAGLRLPILKFSPAFPEEMAAAVGAGLTMTVGEPGNIRALQSVAAAMGAVARVHLKVETGMGRVGAVAAEAPGLALLIERQCPNLHLEGVFTHLPMGDLAEGASFTREQIARFRRVTQEIAAALGRMPEWVHCASSGGILGFREGWMSLVRTGTLCLGYFPIDSPTTPIALAPALSWYTRIAFLKQVEKGTPVSYGHTWRAPRDTWIATLPVGYADGLNRHLSSRGRVLVGGRSCPIAGRICMDQTMIDLGPDTPARVGDEAVLIGRSGAEEITTYEMARLLGTVPCDVTCQIGHRVQRIYDAPVADPPRGALASV